MNRVPIGVPLPTGYHTTTGRPTAAIASFFLGVVAQLSFGSLYVGELLAILFFALARGRSRSENRLMLAAAAWSGAQLLSDIVNDSATESMAKGVLAPWVFALSLLGIARYFRARESSIAYVLLGVTTTTVATILISPDHHQLDNVWKWGMGDAFMSGALAILMLSDKRRLLLITPFLVAFFGWSMLNGARTLATIPFVGFLAYATTKTSVSRRFADWLGRSFPLLRLAGPLVLSVTLLNFAASAAFSSHFVDGLLPHDEDAKFRAQATSSLGLLLAGRNESLISIRAFLDAPILGHGSWAQDKNEYRQQFAQLRSEDGITDPVEHEELNLIPTHSYLMGAAVWCGAVGFLFWLLLTNRVLRLYVRSYVTLPLYFHVGMISFVWDVLFSPFGFSARWHTAIFVGLLFSYDHSTVLPAVAPQGSLRH